jgi:hypothetical protein
MIRGQDPATSTKCSSSLWPPVSLDQYALTSCDPMHVAYFFCFLTKYDSGNNLQCTGWMARSCFIAMTTTPDGPQALLTWREIPHKSLLHVDAMFSSKATLKRRKATPHSRVEINE